MLHFLYFSIQNHIEALHIGENLLHVRLHDLPGIAHTTLVREDELNMVIDGKIKPNAKVNENRNMTTISRIKLIFMLMI